MRIKRDPDDFRCIFCSIHGVREGLGASFKSSSVLLEPYNPAFVTAQGGRFKSSSVLLEPFAIVAVVARSTVF